MDPNGIVSEEWIDDDPIAGNPDSGKGKTFTHHVIYNDGREIYTHYRYGSNDQVGAPEISTNKTQKATWDEAQKKQQAPGGISKRLVDGHWMGYNPETGNYDIDQGPANPPSATPPKEEVDPSDPTKTRIWDPTLNGGQGGWKPGVAVAPKPTTPGATKDINGTTYQQQPDGTWKPAQGLPQDTTKVTPKYQQVKQDETTGKWYGLTTAGTWEPIEGGPGAQGAGPPVPASASGWTPDMSQPDLGMAKRRADVAAMLAAGTFGDPTSPTSVAKANDLLKGDYAVAQTTLSNISNIQQGEGTTYTGQISQRGQDINQANARLNTALGMFQSAYNDIASNAKYAKHGSTVVRALDATLAKAQAFADRIGGLREAPQVQPGPYTSRTAAIFQPKPIEAPAVPPVQAAPEAAPAAAPAPTPAPAPAFTPPPTGAPRTAPATQGPPPAPAPAPSDSTYGPFDPPGYGNPDFPTTPPPPAYQTDYVAPEQQSRLLPLTARAAAGQALVPQRPPTTGGTLAWAAQLGFDPASIDAWAAQ